MNRKQYTICSVIIIAGMGALFGWSITVGNTVIPIVATLVAVIALYLCKLRMEEVIADERSYQIAEKASKDALQIFVVIYAVVGVILTALSRGGYPEMSQIGQLLTFSASALLLLYLAFYGYYSKKYGS